MPVIKKQTKFNRIEVESLLWLKTKDQIIN
jgi:hypothetical protein